jgi:hypothetical protein
MKIVLSGIMLSLYSVLSYAEIQATIDPPQVSTSETFTLTLTQHDSQSGGVPDLTPLQKDYIILGTERHLSYSIINGQSESSSEWVITLKPIKTGILTIPAITMGAEHSTPISINVEANAQKQDTSDEDDLNQDVMLKTEVNEKKPYVNQQIIYTVKLYNSKQLLDADYQGPQVKDALVVPLGDTKRYQTVKNTINYLVEEQNYAIYPQKSGSLTILSPTFTALIYAFNPQRVKVQDKGINLTVLPIPPQYKGKVWLPAKQVKLTEHYENANQTLLQGSTLTRTVTLEGTALPAQLLPNLDFAEPEGASVYPEKGVTHSQIKQGQLVDSIEFKVTYLFNKGGKITIPELNVPWFNTATGKNEHALLPARTIDITPALSSNIKSVTPVTRQSGSVPQNNVPLKSSPEPDQNNKPWLIALFFALAWVITLFLWWQQKHRKLLGKGHYKSALKQLEKACIACNPKQARDALLTWAALHWPDASLLNLTDLTKLVRDVHLKKELQRLSQVLYKNEGNKLWRGDELLKAIHAIKKGPDLKKPKANILPPINPF